jgi:hypothetical protein
LERLKRRESISDVEEEMDALQRRLTAKNRGIEALVAADQNLGDLNAMESTDYVRLQAYVEELIYNISGGEGSPFRVHESEIWEVGQRPPGEQIDKPRCRRFSRQQNTT